MDAEHISKARRREPEHCADPKYLTRHDRRSVVTGLLGLAFSADPAWKTLADVSPPSRRDDQPGVVSLELALTQVILSLGVTPLAVVAPHAYRDRIVEPPLPENVPSTGVGAGGPNLELLRLLKPDLILMNNLTLASTRAVLSPIARLWGRWNNFFSSDPYGEAEAYHIEIAELLGREEIGQDYCEKLRAKLGAMRDRLPRKGNRSVLVMAVLSDPRHATVYVSNSILQGALDRLGLRNAWPGKPVPLGANYLGLEQLATIENADFIIIDMANKGTPHRLMESPLWKVMRPVREGRVALLPPIYTQGLLPTLDRFVGLLPGAFEQMERGHG